tara:strand:- start:26 stop:319 length:294 start_codon:yes stop_codon:yes gene_type:complete
LSNTIENGMIIRSQKRICFRLGDSDFKNSLLSKDKIKPTLSKYLIHFILLVEGTICMRVGIEYLLKCPIEESKVENRNWQAGTYINKIPLSESSDNM